VRKLPDRRAISRLQRAFVGVTLITLGVLRPLAGMGGSDMPKTSKRRRVKEALPVVGLVGVSMSLAGGASAATVGTAADIPSQDKGPAPGSQITLNEEEISDVSLGTFFVFDKEIVGAKAGQQFARGCGGCRGCGGRGCGGCRGCGRGCRGCRGCGGCGCGGGGSCCLSWGVCQPWC